MNETQTAPLSLSNGHVDHHHSPVSVTAREDLPPRPRRPRKQRRIACAPCRNAKVRCDGSKSPCARCQRLGVDCQKVAGIAKPSRQGQVEDLEKEVRDLRSMLSQNRQISPTNLPPLFTDVDSPASPLQLPRSTHSGSSNGPAKVPSRSITSSEREEGLRNVAFPFVGNVFNNSTRETPPQVDPCGGDNGLGQLWPIMISATTPRSIDSVDLDPAQIERLFQTYFEHYHAFLPMLDPLRSANEYYVESPLLFWSIVGVASRRYREDITLLTTLSNSVMGLVWATVSKPPSTLPTIEALLLLCTWPFPTSLLWTDATTQLSGIAVIAAMQLGLHQNTSEGFSRTTKHNMNDAAYRRRAAAWASCDIVTQHMTATLGLPRLAYFNWKSDRAREPGRGQYLPDDLYHQLMIQRICDRLNYAMWNEWSNATGASCISNPCSLLASTETDLAVFEQEFGHQLSRTTRLYLVAARLYLQAFHFLDSYSTRNRKEGILKAYHTAFDLISDFNEADTIFHMFQYIPNYLFRMLFTAACALLKVLLSDYSKDVDFESGKRQFNTAVVTLRQCSVENNDISGRSAEIMAQLWAAFRDTRTGVPVLRAQGRLGASLGFDCLWRWRDRYEEQVRGHTLATAPTQSESDLETQGRSSFSHVPNYMTMPPDIFDDATWM